MTPDQWVTVISAVGIPGVALYFLATWTAKRLEKAEIAAQDRETNLVKEITNVRVDLRSLEIEVRTELVVLLRETKIALKENTAVMSQVVGRLELRTDPHGDSRVEETTRPSKEDEG